MERLPLWMERLRIDAMWWAGAMPFLLVPGERVGAAVAAVYGLIAEGGTDAVTMRAVAGRVGISVGTLAHDFRYKAHLWKLSTWRIGQELVGDLERSTRIRGVAGFLPESPEETEGVAVWLALRALGRVSSEVAHQVNAVDADLRALLCRRLEEATAAPVRLAPDAPQVVQVWAVLQGLWVERVRAQPAITGGQAADVLRLALEARA
jgi:AcrR family transcriptional regulator